MAARGGSTQRCWPGGFASGVRTGRTTRSRAANTFAACDAAVPPVGAAGGRGCDAVQRGIKTVEVVESRRRSDQRAILVHDLVSRTLTSPTEHGEPR